MNSSTGAALEGAEVAIHNLETSAERSVNTAASGFYAAPLLSPGRYRIRVSADRYQAQEFWDVTLAVSANLELSFKLRPLEDVWEAQQPRSVFLPDTGAILNIYGPDVDNTRVFTRQAPRISMGRLESSMSYVVDPQQLAALPLSGRDVYRLILFQPGMTLGYSASGQRSSSSNFLLDGVDNNDQGGSGPQAIIAPEAIQEYRVSVNGYSAEFGRTGGYIANAVTRSGSNTFHGLLYSYINDESFNANSSEFNRKATPRPPKLETYAGGSISIPVRRNKTFAAASYERFHSGSRAFPFDFRIPVLERFRTCDQIPRDSLGLRLLERFPGPVVSAASGVSSCDALSGVHTASPPYTVGRRLGLARLDHALSGGTRAMFRYANGSYSQPDATFNPIAPFISGTFVENHSAAGTVTNSFGGATLNEIRAAWNVRTSELPRPFPEVPDLRVQRDGNTVFPFGISLPGSQAFVSSQMTAQLVETSDTLTLIRGSHVITTGGSLILRRVTSESQTRPQGTFFFPDLLSFAQDKASSLQVIVKRDALQRGMLEAPDPSGRFRNNQFAVFVQDSFPVTRRLRVNLGVRYESFGTLVNTGPADAYIKVGTGGDIVERIAGAELVFPQGRGRETYRPDRNNWAARAGLSYDIFGTGRTFFRAAAGTFYDRPADVLTQPIAVNNVQLANLAFEPDRPLNIDYTQPLSSNLTRLRESALAVFATRNIGTVWIDEGLRMPVVNSWFAVLEQQVTRSLSVEVSHLGSVGGKLFSNDLVNRTDAFGDEGSRINPALPDLQFRSNSGSSTYTALTGMIDYRSRRLLFRAGYTWGHSIDNQSSPFGFFTRQFDSRIDRGNSDFDQRHGLVSYGIWELPDFQRAPAMLKPVVRDWRVAHTAAMRSGGPVSVLADNPAIRPCPFTSDVRSDSLLLANRPSLLPGADPKLRPPRPVTGGVQYLNPDAFCSAPRGTLGTLGRNALTGPGFWVVDLSIAKTFPLRRLREGLAFQIRADLFNVFNHPNLTNPDGLFGIGPGSFFGQATYGGLGAPSALPSVAPLDALPRRVQLQLRFMF